MKHWLLPSIIVAFGLISVATLKSVAPQLATQQAIFFILGLCVFFVTTHITYKQLMAIAWPMYSIVCALLIVSMIAGLVMGKTGRWIPLGLFNLQPSQLAIPVVAILLGKLQQAMSFNTWKNIAKVFAIIGIPGVLILIEPDLGTTIVYLVSVGAILFMSDISWSKLVTLVSFAVLTSIFAWFFILHDYQKQRITSFIDPHADVSGASYNARQALIAAGSGRLLGRGLGQGVQSHLRFLPERQTDFIFASFAEESGFIGAIFVLSLYTLLVGHILFISQKAPSTAPRTFCISIALMTIIQAGVNIGMNIGIMPITGITLPLLSYGGSSILSLCAMYGIVHTIAKDVTIKPALHLA